MRIICVGHGSAGLAMIALALAGCATVQEPVVVETLVPVPVACQAIEIEEPLWAVDSLPIGADIYEQTKALRAERQQRISYEIKLRAAARQRPP